MPPQPLSPRAFIECLLDLISTLKIAEYSGEALFHVGATFAESVSAKPFRELLDELSEEHRQEIAMDWLTFMTALNQRNPSKESLRAALQPIRFRLGVADPLPIEAYLVPSYDNGDDGDTAPSHPPSHPQEMKAAWLELGAIVEHLDTVHVQTSQLRRQMGAALGVGDGETSVALGAGPIATPDDLDALDAKGTKQPVAVIGGIIAGLTAIALMLLLLPTGQTVSEKPTTVTDRYRSRIPELPVTEQDYATCESPTRQVAGAPAPTTAPPKWRKAAKVQFLKDNDSVILVREGEPDLLVTVTELTDEAPLVANPARTYTVDTEAYGGYGVQFGIDPHIQLTLEFAQ